MDSWADELSRDGSTWAYFTPYEPNFTPAQHQERQDERRKEGLQWRIALLGFVGALLGGILGAILGAVFGK